MKKAFFSFLLSFTLVGPHLAGAAGATSDCGRAGPGAEFCSGATFARVDAGQTRGMSFWMHRAGYLSKVLVQEMPQEGARRGDIEAAIISIVSQQASSIGRSFEFSDISSSTRGGAPFGTLTYTLSGQSGDKPILHSYVAVKGVVVQVISQLAVKTADPGPQALHAAHRDAVAAIHLKGPGSDI